MTDRVAVISDVHGNRQAREAVLEDIRTRGISTILNLGDCSYGPLDPAGTAEILMAADYATVRGNEDRILVEPADGEESLTVGYTRDCLTPAQLNWLSSLPAPAVVLDEFFLCHGTPDRDDQYLLFDVTPHGAERRDARTLVERLGDIPQPVVLCGHDHTPAVVPLADGTLIVNPGSVGLQAYTDDTPFAHHMQTGSPHARFAVLERNSGGWQGEIVQIAYDWNEASDRAAKNGRPDWSHWLRTGFAR